MPFFFRSIIGVVLVVGLAFAVGCTSTQSGGKSAKTNIFSRTPPKQEKAASLGDFLRQERATTLLTR